jgi:AcrR family transcriptional regulator
MTLRADAARNRQAIVEAAREVFAEHGLDVPLDDIAKRAGTGNATLYRRFPQRADLVAAVFAERMAEHVDAVQAALADADPWNGFASYIRAAGVMQARDRGIADLVTMDLSAAPEVEDLRGRAYDGLVRLVARAQEAGMLRADFTDQDVVLLQMANAGLVERAHGISADASARLIALLLDGMRAQAATPGPDAREGMTAPPQHCSTRTLHEGPVT